MGLQAIGKRRSPCPLVLVRSARRSDCPLEHSLVRPQFIEFLRRNEFGQQIREDGPPGTC